MANLPPLTALAYKRWLAKDATATDVHVDSVASERPKRRKRRTGGGYVAVDPEEVNETPAQEAAEEPVLASIHGTVSGAVPLSKSIAPLRYTFSPVYIPNAYDAHNEWMSTEDLQKAVWDLSTNGDRELNLQHIGGTVAGRWVELACIPWEHEATLEVPGQGLRKVAFPPDTPWMGVIWEPFAYEAIQKGLLRGLSIEGAARRTVAEIEGL